MIVILNLMTLNILFAVGKYVYPFHPKLIFARGSQVVAPHRMAPEYLINIRLG